MSIIKRKSEVAEPTITEQLAEAQLDAANALSVFKHAADELHLASLKQDALAGLLYDQIEALEAEALAAISASVENAAASLRVRELTGVFA